MYELNTVSELDANILKLKLKNFGMFVEYKGACYAGAL